MLLQFVYICLLGPEPNHGSKVLEECLFNLLDSEDLSQNVCCSQNCCFLDFMQLAVAWDFGNLFFNNSKGTYNNRNYHCSLLPHAVFFSKSLCLDSFSDTLRGVFLSNGMACQQGYICFPTYS